MRSEWLVLAFLALVSVAWAGAGASEPQDKAPLVRELDLKGFKGPEANGMVSKPTPITTAAELAKAITDKAGQAAIAKQVDFAKEQLVLFAWSGSGQDKLTFTVAKGEGGPLVAFNYKGGLTRDLRPHVYLYAIPKNAKWNVNTLK